MSDDQCAGRCGIEWARTILQARGDADASERRWHRATFALAGGVRDWPFLLTPLSPPTPRTRFSGHVLHALARLPNDPHARLARAIAIASRNIVADEMDAPRTGERGGPAPTMPMRPLVAELVASRLQTSLVYAQQEFIKLLNDPVVGPEAHMRLGLPSLPGRSVPTRRSRLRRRRERRRAMRTCATSPISSPPRPRRRRAISRPLKSCTRKRSTRGQIHSRRPSVSPRSCFSGATPEGPTTRSSAPAPGGRMTTTPGGSFCTEATRSCRR